MQVITAENRERGFTLVEILIALTLFAIGILAVARMQDHSIRTDAYSRATSEATVLAQNKLEELMSLSYSDSDLDAGNHGPETSDIFTVVWAVANDTPVLRTKTIQVDVSWKSWGNSKSLTLNSIKTR